MRLSICTVAATLFTSTLAAPTSKFEQYADTSKGSAIEVVKRDGDGKYFHEPGYVMSTS